MTNPTSKHAIGDRVIIQNRGGGWDGVTGRVLAITTGGDYSVQYDDPASTPFGEGWVLGTWTHDSGYLVKLSGEEEPKGLRATLQHDTSREYAEHATSRLLPAWANDTLKAAAAGQEVDVVEFRKAATQALSLAATRAGQSPLRRRYTKEARHLIYWADAIIDNHLAGLPVYEGGPRSPKIAELRNEISTLTQAASDERRRLCAEINDLQESRRKAIANVRDAANNEIDSLKARAADLIKEKSDLEIRLEDTQKRAYEETQHLYLEINEAHAALEYAFTLLGKEDQGRLAGFRDGYATRVNDEA